MPTSVLRVAGRTEATALELRLPVSSTVRSALHLIYLYTYSYHSPEVEAFLCLHKRVVCGCGCRLVREKVAAHFNEATSSVLLFRKPSAKVGNPCPRSQSYSLTLLSYNLLIHCSPHLMHTSSLLTLLWTLQVGAVGERVDRDGNSLEEEGWAGTQTVVLLAKKNDKAPTGSQVGTRPLSI
jgi:hypothetical protein